MDLRFYLLILLRRLPWFLLMLVIGTAAGLTVARILPASYVSQARLVVESEQIPGTLAASTVKTDTNEQLQIIQQRILSRENLLDMANRLNIYSGNPDRLSPDQMVQDLRTRTTLAITGGALPRRAVQATLITVGFQAPTSQMAASVANDLVTMILREDVSMRTGIARQTLDFFQQEVSRLNGELTRISGELLAFKEQNQGALPETLDFRRNQLSVLQTRVQDVDRLEAQLRDRRAQLERLKASASQSGALPPSSNQTPEQARLQALRQELSQAEAVLASNHPRVAMLQAQIRAQEKIVSDQLAASGLGEADAGPTSLFDLQIADVDAQIAAAEEQRSQATASIAALQASIEATPANAVRIDSLTRDYSNIQAQYNDAVIKRARAETGEVIESLSKGQKISVIEQAVAPNRPNKPNRLMIAAIGAGVGLVLGLAVAVLPVLLTPRIRRPSEIVNRLGITPLITLPYIRTEEESRKRRKTVALGLLAAALAVVIGLSLVHLFFVPLDQIVERFSLTDTSGLIIPV